MGFFNRVEQDDSNDVVNEVSTKTITKKLNIRNKPCSISVEDAKIGKVDGKEVILDEALVNSTIRQIGIAVENNCSKYNPIPNKIVITHRDTGKVVNIVLLPPSLIRKQTGTFVHPLPELLPAEIGLSSQPVFRL